MWYGVVTLFPEMFTALTDYGVTGRAINHDLVKLELSNPRDYTDDIHRTVDDRPYGGGPGMVMKVEPLRKAIQDLRDKAPCQARVVVLSPQGKKITQALVQDIVKESKPVILVAGRYEGIDERLFELEAVEEWSIGDYVLSGGELAAMVVLDAMMRVVPGALGHADSAQQDSFSDGMLDCPHYTRPIEVAGITVPEVLLSGDHEMIAKWRLEQKQQRTLARRPDLEKGAYNNE